MSETYGFSPEDAQFLANLGNEMDAHFETPAITPEDMRERIQLFDRYFSNERQQLITNYLEDRTDSFHRSEIREQEENHKSVFDDTVKHMLQMKDPIYVTSDNIPLGKDIILIRLLHAADLSQNDLNLLETDHPIRMISSDIRDKILTIMEFREDERADRIIALFDTYVWSTVQRFLEFGESQP